MSFARMIVCAAQHSLCAPFIYHTKEQLLLCSSATATATLNLSTMDDSHFRVDHGL